MTDCPLTFWCAFATVPFYRKHKKPSLIIEQEIDSSEVSLSEFFREKRKELQLQAGSGKRRDFFSLGQIAENLGVSKAVLEGKLYRKPGKTISREWVIALSVVHGINSDDANKALLLCDFPRLDAALPQEDLIIDFLEDHEGESLKHSNNGPPERKVKQTDQHKDGYTR